MSTILYDSNIKTIYDLTAGTSMADADAFVYWDSVASMMKKISRTNLQTDIASRCVDDLSIAAAITTANTVVAGAKMVGALYNTALQKSLGSVAPSSSSTITLNASSVYLVLGYTWFNTMQCASLIFTAFSSSGGQSKKVDIATATNVTININKVSLTINNTDTSLTAYYSVVKLN